MELRQLKTFQMVAKLSSFNRAAEILNYAPSTVSTQIRLLEEEFQVPLFNRLGKRIHLTEAGKMLIQYSQKMLDIENETIAKVSGWQEPQGSLSIRMPQSIGTYLMPSVLEKFQIDYPKISFDIGTCAYETLVHELKTGMIDIAFLLTEAIPFIELESEFLKTEPLVIVSSPKHPLAQQSSVYLHDLLGDSILLPKHDCSYKMLFEKLLVEEQENPPLFTEIHCIETIKQCVMKNIGIAMFPMMAVRQEIAEGKLALLPCPEDRLETAILMIWHKDKWISPILKDFMKTVRDVMADSEDQQSAP